MLNEAVILKSTVLHADKAQAESVTADLLSITYPKSGNPVARKVETGKGWQVLVPMIARDGEKKRCVVLEWIEVNGTKRFRYDPRVVTMTIG